MYVGMLFIMQSQLLSLLFSLNKSYPYRLSVRTSGFQPEKRSSILRRDTKCEEEDYHIRDNQSLEHLCWKEGKPSYKEVVIILMVVITTSEQSNVVKHDNACGLIVSVEHLREFNLNFYFVLFPVV